MRQDYERKRRTDDLLIETKWKVMGAKDSMIRILDALSNERKQSTENPQVEDGMVLGVCKIAIVHILILRHFKDSDKQCQTIANEYRDKLTEFGNANPDFNYSRILTVNDYLDHLETSNSVFLVLERLIDELVSYSTKIVTRQSSAKNKDEWCFEMVDKLLKHYNEPLLNMHFLSPYMKDSLAALGSYDLIFELLPFLPDDDLTEVPSGEKDKIMKTSTMMFLDGIIKTVQKLKTDIVYTLEEENGERLNKVLVYIHLLIQIISRGQFLWHSE